jgi:beta-glucosidase
MKNKILLLSLFALIPAASKPMASESNFKTLAQGLFNHGYQFLQSHPKISAATLTAVALGTTWYCANGYERRENWEGRQLDLSALPAKFDFGAATSCTQWSGLQYKKDGSLVKNNWTTWLEEQPQDKQIGTASDHWTKYSEDFKCAKEFGLDRLRISLEWGKYQQNDPNNLDNPDEKYNEDVINHYIDEIRELKRQGLKVTLCFYHHVLPNWFVERGGFEKAENITYFVDAAHHIFNRINEKLQDEGNPLDPEKDLILTFNEPAGYALAAYVYGKYPPGKKMELEQCGIVTKNMLDAHVKLRQSIKKIDNKFKVSIAHMMRPIQPYNPWNPLDIVPAKIFGYLLNNVTLEYLSTGKFRWLNHKKIGGLKIPWFTTQINEEAKDSLDFVGVNYYTHTLLNWLKSKVRPSEITSHAEEGEQGNAIYAEGFYDCLKVAHKHFPTQPIYVTELGFADNDKEGYEKSLEFTKQHLYVIIEAIKKDNMNIIGLDWWTLTDCYGWNGGNGSTYGLYAVDLNHPDKPRSIKESSLFLKELIGAYKHLHSKEE